MSNTVIAIKKSSTPSAVPSDLANGELAINYADGKLYYKAANGTIASISGTESNFFGTVNANNSLIVADTPGDILTLVAGQNIQIVGDTINDTITISAASVPASVVTSDTPPASPADGDLWWNTDQLRMFIYYDDGSSAQWVETVPSYIYTLSEIASAFSQANIANATAWQAFDKANAANIIASQAFDKANTGTTIAAASYNAANIAVTIATFAYDASNTVNAITIGTSANTYSTNYANSTFVKLTSDYQTITGNVQINQGTLAIGTSPSADYILAAPGGTDGFGKAFLAPDILSAGGNNWIQYFYGAHVFTYNSKYKNVGGTGWTRGADGNLSSIMLNNRGVEFYAAGNGAAGAGVYSDPRMTVTWDGNVVIGRTTSTVGQDVKLDVNGAVNASSFLINEVPVSSTIAAVNAIAVAAFTAANSASGGGPAFDKANSANIIASQAFDKANAANVLAFNALPNTSGATFAGNLTIAGNLTVTDAISNVDSITFNTSAGVTTLANGQLAWNTTEQTLDLVVDSQNGGTVLQIGQEMYYRVKNQTGSTIPNGTVVMAAGTVGASGRILVTPAIADGTYPSKYVMGITTEDIADGGDGFVTAFGKIHGLDTTAFSEGDILYADPAVPGGLANTIPSAPNKKITVAIVINKHAINGTLFVRPTYGSSLNEDELVELNSLTNNDVLVYNSANGRFENKDQTTLIPYGIAVAAFDKANAANVLAFNTGIGANAFAAATIAGANAAVGAGANSFASATIDGANNIAIAAFARANTGVNTFTSLTDVPSSYANSANYLVTVNPTATGLQFSQDISLDELIHTARIAPTTVANDSVTVYVTATGTSPNREVAYKIKNELGEEVIISSILT